MKDPCPHLVCPVHHKPAIHLFPCCVGAKGGARMSPAQLARNKTAAKRKRKKP